MFMLHTSYDKYVEDWVGKGGGGGGVELRAIHCVDTHVKYTYWRGRIGYHNSSLSPPSLSLQLQTSPVVCTGGLSLKVSVTIGN